MLPSLLEFAKEVIKPEYVTGKDVQETGAKDFNGSVRGLVEAMNPRSYLGTDIEAGLGVDQICDAQDLVPHSADLLLSFEMLEHAERWRNASMGMANALRLDGYLIITTRSPGYPRHCEPDHNRFNIYHMHALLLAMGTDIIVCRHDKGSNGVCAVGKKVRSADPWAMTALQVEAAPAS